MKELLDVGCYEVSLGDTLGVGSPSNVRTLLIYLLSNGIPLEKLAGHFHDTYGQAVANVWEAYSHGTRVFDSSVAGLGGCPFAEGAKGNVASEDLVYMFHNAVSVPALICQSWWKRESGSQSSSQGQILVEPAQRLRLRAKPRMLRASLPRLLPSNGASSPKQKERSFTDQASS